MFETAYMTRFAVGCIQMIKKGFSVIKDILERTYIWVFSRTPHRCRNWESYWEDAYGRGLFCGACGKVLDEEVYPVYE